jgi:DNA polymerase-3 subunit epsilon
VALDFETTGLDFRRDTIVSFGLVPIREARIEMAGARYREVSPEVPPSPESIRVHHLRQRDLALAPSLEDVRDELAAGLEGQFLIAWVAEVEANFLAKIFSSGTGRWLRRTLDVYRLARYVEMMDRPSSGEEGGGLESTARRFGIPVEEAHHALDDALMTAELLLVLATRLSTHSVGSVRSLMRAARRVREPVRQRRRPPFGSQSIC